jgi:hypothetical protein
MSRAQLDSSIQFRKTLGLHMAAMQNRRPNVPVFLAADINAICDDLDTTKDDINGACHVKIICISYLFSMLFKLLTKLIYLSLR